jgi:glycosyltransferase involved in cell wall biosynthesis
MKVLQLISSAGYYGAENMVVGLAPALSALGCSSVIGVFDNRHRPNTQMADAAADCGLPVERIACRGRWDWNAVRAIRECVKKNGVDLIHTHGYKADLYAYAAQRGFGIPLIATCHNWTRQTAALRAFEYMDRLALRRFSKVVAVSDAVGETLLRAGVRQYRICNIANGIDPVPFEGGTQTLAQELHKGNKILVGVVARLDLKKGLQYFLQAANTVAIEYPNTLFALVGEGPDRAALEQMTRELSLSDRVVFTGARRDMPGVYASLDIFVLPSLMEGLPIAVLEAQAAGKPVIATRVGAIPKVVTDGETGLLIEPGDAKALGAAITRLITDVHLRRQLGYGGHARIHESFTSSVMARRYLDLYQGLLAGKAMSDRCM